jgi:hypothetical protein
MILCDKLTGYPPPLDGPQVAEWWIEAIGRNA